MGDSITSKITTKIRSKRQYEEKVMTKEVRRERIWKTECNHDSLQSDRGSAKALISEFIAL